MVTCLLGLLLVGVTAGSDVVRVTNADGLVDLANNVSNGERYEGVTVFLDSDLDFSGKVFEPVGNTTHYFNGTFDGQGHTVSNLEMNSTSLYSGLFGYSEGIIIKNVVIDSSCSFVNSYVGSDDIYLGGIIGHCYAKAGLCNIENNVNMANIAFNGNLTGYYYYSYLGGILGRLYSYSYGSIVKNCVNYGSVERSGQSKYSSIGGIAGYSSCSSSTGISIQNCLNYGDIIHSGSSKDSLYIGGIVGYIYSSNVENCVSVGIISSNTTSNYIGSIVGCLYSDSSLSNSYWSQSIVYNAYGSTYSSTISEIAKFDDNFVLNETVSIGVYSGTSLIEVLNAYSGYYDLRDYSYWLFNKNEKDVAFKTNNYNGFTLNSRIILLPSLANEGKLWFDGWYNDNTYSTPFTRNEITENTELYGKWEDNNNYYTISFDTRGGTPVEPITSPLGSIVNLPRNTARSYCTVAFWENKYGGRVSWNFTVLAHDVTLYAVWQCTHITTAEELITLSKFVNSGTSFEGVTVFLDADLDFSGKAFESIGYYNSFNDYNCFLGSFDGQGHTISNLKMLLTSNSVGLFGYSDGMTIKNVVIDSSCLFVNFYGSSSSKYRYYRAERDPILYYMGGIIAYCASSNSPCAIENSVNMANVVFDGDISRFDYLYIGGIVGSLYSGSFDSIVKNCANYGSVEDSGASVNSYIGGIVGYLSSSSLSKTSIQNSLNQGDVIHNGTTRNDLYLGGVVGLGSYAVIDNCVSAGNVSSNTTSNYIGSIAGYLSTDSSLSHCYWNENINYDCNAGSSSEALSEIAKFDDNFILNETVSIGNYSGTSLIEALNAAADYYDLREYSHWLFNKNEKDVTFKINKYNGFTLNSRIILLPNLANEGKLWLDGWYNDTAYSTPFTENGITENTELYGIWEENNKEYTISFDTRGGTPVEPITSPLGSIVNLPNNSVKDRYTIAFWENKYGDRVSWVYTVPAHNITLYPVLLLTHIKVVEDFTEFSNNLKKGETYKGMTAFLDADLDFSGKTFEPIGNEDNYFLGTFDGQGHTINNLEMNSSSMYSGLFGYSGGTTIKNVVIDSSCSFVSSRVDPGDAYVGGIIGYCDSWNGPCNIENSVNMANISFNGNIGYRLYLGGLIGNLGSFERDSIVKNCANYGSVTHSGESKYSDIGGIVGYSYRYSSYGIFIQNCFNYGRISHNGATSSDLYIGGIAGYTSYTVIENCVSAGIIFSNTTSKYIWSIAGYVYSAISESIIHSFWTSDVGYNSSFGSGTPTIDNEIPQVELNMTTVDKLNTYASSKSWNKWLLNKNNVPVSFRINNGKGFSLDSQLVLLPDLADNNERSFSGWYNDELLTSPFMGSEVGSSTTLYGSFCGPDLIVTFDVNGGDELDKDEIVVECNETYGTLPTPVRAEAVFDGWFTERVGGLRVESNSRVTILRNHTLYAHWTVNKYTVTFIFSNGIDPEVRTFDFNASIDYPNAPMRDGYTFNGWDKIINLMPAQNVTIAAQWIDRPTQFVEIVFSRVDLKEEEAARIIKAYTNEEFIIEGFEVDETTGESRLIIRFTDVAKSEEFVRSINDHKRAVDSFISRANGVERKSSFSFLLTPLSLLFNLIII